MQAAALMPAAAQTGRRAQRRRPRRAQPGPSAAGLWQKLETASGRLVLIVDRDGQHVQGAIARCF